MKGKCEGGTTTMNATMLFEEMKQLAEQAEENAELKALRLELLSSKDGQKLVDVLAGCILVNPTGLPTYVAMLAIAAQRVSIAQLMEESFEWREL